MKFSHRLKVSLIISFASLSALDILTTLLDFKLGSTEANPITKFFITSFGLLFGLVVGKTTMTATVIPIYFVISRIREVDGQTLFLIGLNSVYILIVSWNLVVLSLH